MLYPLIVVPDGVAGFNGGTFYSTSIAGPPGCTVPPSTEHDVDPIVIARIAKKYEGSLRWREVTSYACNRFVADVLTEAGAAPPMIGGRLGQLRGALGLNWNPPTAGEWGDRTVDIRGWTVVAGGASAALPGDVVAEKVNFVDASGHVGIVVDGRLTASADDTAQPAGKITLKDFGFRKDNDPAHPHGWASQCVFRRRIHYCTSTSMYRSWA